MVYMMQYRRDKEKFDQNNARNLPSFVHGRTYESSVGRHVYY